MGARAKINVLSGQLLRPVASNDCDCDSEFTNSHPSKRSVVKITIIMTSNARQDALRN